MARKLFALENDGGEVEEMETGDLEVGEVADVETEAAGETDDIGETSDSLDTAVDAAGEGEQIEELVETAAEDEGLSPVAAEAVRIALEAVCAKVGYNPKSVYSLYATENFSSPSSRKSNTRIALEGVGEFLKDMWKKIKATLTSLWTKVKAFWAKHVSTLGRIVKALESMKAKVSASSGKLDGKAYVDEAPSGLVSAFAGKDDINKAVINKYITAHGLAIAKLTTITDKAEDLNKVKFTAETISDEDIARAMRGIDDSAIEFGSKDAPLIGGQYQTVKFGTKSGTDDNGGFEFEVEKETIDSAETKLGLSVSSKEDLKSILTATQETIKATVKYKEKSDKLASATSKFLSEVSMAIEKPETKGTPRDPETAKVLRKFIKFYYKLNSKIPSIANDVFGYNVKLAKAVLAYCSFCLKQYK